MSRRRSFSSNLSRATRITRDVEAVESGHARAEGLRMLCLAVRWRLRISGRCSPEASDRNVYVKTLGDPSRSGTRNQDGGSSCARLAPRRPSGPRLEETRSGTPSTRRMGGRGSASVSRGNVSASGDERGYHDCGVVQVGRGSSRGEVARRAQMPRRNHRGAPARRPRSAARTGEPTHGTRLRGVCPSAAPRGAAPHCRASGQLAELRSGGLRPPVDDAIRSRMGDTSRSAWRLAPAAPLGARGSQHVMAKRLAPFRPRPLRQGLFRPHTRGGLPSVG
jgi:hypothetical protein